MAQICTFTFRNILVISCGIVVASEHDQEVAHLTASSVTSLGKLFTHVSVAKQYSLVLAE